MPSAEKNVGNHAIVFVLPPVYDSKFFMSSDGENVSSDPMHAAISYSPVNDIPEITVNVMLPKSGVPP